MASFEHVHNFRDFGADGAHRGRGQRNPEVEGADEGAELGRGIRSALSAELPCDWGINDTIGRLDTKPHSHTT